jgi:DNA-binding response OmpR family regulator
MKPLNQDWTPRTHGMTPITETMRKPSMKLVLLRSLGECAVAWDSHFRKLGWTVRIAEDVDNARQLARRVRVVILPAHTNGESGFLTARKMLLESPNTRVLLVGPEQEELERYALFAGAAGYVSANVPLAELTTLVTGVTAK